MRVIIAGGRDFNNYKILCKVCDHMLSKQNNIEIISGGANGADKLGEKYANERGYKIKQFLAKWDLYGKSAGFIRNEQMAEYGEALIAFWDESSKGTEHMIELAKKYELKIKISSYDKF